MIRLILCISMPHDGLGKSLEPCMRRLFQPIERFSKLVDFPTFLPWSNPKGNSMYSSSRSPFIKTFLMSSYWSHQSRFVARDKRTVTVLSLAIWVNVHFLIVNTISLCKSLSYQPCLVFFNEPIWLLFSSKHPFASNKHISLGLSTKSQVRFFFF